MWHTHLTKYSSFPPLFVTLSSYSLSEDPPHPHLPFPHEQIPLLPLFKKHNGLSQKKKQQQQNTNKHSFTSVSTSYSFFHFFFLFAVYLECTATPHFLSVPPYFIASCTVRRFAFFNFSFIFQNKTKSLSITLHHHDVNWHIHLSRLFFFPIFFGRFFPSLFIISKQRFLKERTKYYRRCVIPLFCFEKNSP